MADNRKDRYNYYYKNKIAIFFVIAQDVVYWSVDPMANPEKNKMISGASKWDTVVWFPLKFRKHSVTQKFKSNAQK